MNDISKIDENFEVNETLPNDDTDYFDCMLKPFELYGVEPPKTQDDVFRRMPKETAEAVSPEVAYLSTNAAGGRLRFRTDSPFVTVKAEFSSVGRMPHFTLCGAAGFDMYRESVDTFVFVGTFQPPYGFETEFTSRLSAETDGDTDITLHLPLYGTLRSLKIGLKKGASLKAPRPYLHTLPFVSYGSSITQGGCASRPGMAYQNILSRELSVDHVNLGFSGSAKGETAMAEYISGLDMSVFIYDYDHNAPTAEHLAETHERFFKIIRAAQPTLPVIMLSRPKNPLTDDEKLRRDIIETTYKNAVAAGDRNVYFIDGSSLMRFTGGNEGTVDNCHPTDLGFRRIADGISEVLCRLL